MQIFTKNFKKLHFLKDGIAWSFGASLINFIFVILLNIVLARIMGVTEFGEFVVMQSIVLTISSMCQIAIGYTVGYFVSKYAQLDKNRLGRIIVLFKIISLIMGVLGLGLTVIFGNLLVRGWLEKPEITTNCIIYASGAVFFQVISGYQIGVLIGSKSFKNLAKSLGIGCFFIFIATVVFAAFGGVELAVLGLATGYGLQSVVLYVAVRNSIRKLGIKTYNKNIFIELPAVIHFWAPAALAGLVSLPLSWLASSFLIREADGLTQIAVFYSVDRFRSAVLFLPQIVNRVSLTFMNENSSSDKNQIFTQIFKQTLVLSFALAVTGGLAIALLGNIYIYTLGKEFDKAYIILNILLVSSFIEVLWQSIYLIIPTKGSMWRSMFFLTVPRDFTLVICAWVLVPLLQGVGLALSHVISWISASVFLYILIVRSKIFKFSSLSCDTGSPIKDHRL